MEWTPGCGLPGPDEIAAGCEAIQATWTEDVREKRLVGTPEPLTVPEIKVCELGC